MCIFVVKMCIFVCLLRCFGGYSFALMLFFGLGYFWRDSWGDGVGSFACLLLDFCGEGGVCVCRLLGCCFFVLYCCIVGSLW